MKAILIVIKEYMKTSGITTNQLSKNCGISEPMISAILNGLYPLNAADYGCICDGLGVKYSSFYRMAKGVWLSSKLF